jgi:hypothetical protein
VDGNAISVDKRGIAKKVRKKARPTLAPSPGEGIEISYALLRESGTGQK